MQQSVPNSSADSAPASLEPYAQLLRALLPRMSHMTVFNARGELHWSTESMIGPELNARVSDSLRAAVSEPAASGHRLSINGEPTYIFWLRRDDAAPGTAPFAIVVVGIRPTGSDNDKRPFAFVHGLVKPGIECLRRELLARNEILELHNSLLEQDSGLEMLLSITGGDQNDSLATTHDLKAIVSSAAEHLQVGLSALIVPEIGITLVLPSANSPLDASLLAKAHRHLMSMARVRQSAVIVNQLSLQSGDKAIICRCVACPVMRTDGRSVGVLALFRAPDAPEFNNHHGRLAELLARRVASIIAHSYDTLTGLLTRPAFEQRVGASLQAQQSANVWWSAIYADINRMHVINDNMGMHIGDRVISQIGELIRSRMLPGSIGARISGDRFAILLPAGLDAAAKFGEALRASAEELGPKMGDGRVPITISVGVAAVEPRSKDFVHAFAAAETACKAANDRGRNRVEIYREVDESIVRRFTDINLIAELRSALAEGRFELNAQMIVPLAGYAVAPHFEILLRMANERGDLQGPDHFMSAAQRYQMMPTIDRWVISHAIEMLKPYRDVLRKSKVVFNINFSGQSLQDADFTDHVVRLIESSGVHPGSLCLELTESAAIGNLARAEELMRRLRKVGCSIALDDFGTGLSSLAYLRSLPINMLKIDGSFVRDVLKDPRAESMIQVIAQLARAMSMTTVAEYVETDEIRARVAALGVDLGQGFAIARPVPLTEVLTELPIYASANGTEDWARTGDVPMAHSA